MTCPVCGADNRVGARFCRQCGADLSQPPVTPVVEELIATADDTPLPLPPAAPDEPAPAEPTPDEPTPDGPGAAAPDGESAPATAPVTTDEAEPETEPEVAAVSADEAEPEAEPVAADEAEPEVALDETDEGEPVALDETDAAEPESPAFEETPTEPLAHMGGPEEAAPEQEDTPAAETAPESEPLAVAESAPEAVPFAPYDPYAPDAAFDADHDTIELATSTLDDKPTIKLAPIAPEDDITAQLSPNAVVDEPVADEGEAATDSATAEVAAETATEATPEVTVAANDDNSAELKSESIAPSAAATENELQEATSAPGAARGELELAGGYAADAEEAAPASDLPATDGAKPVPTNTTGAEEDPTMLTGGQRETRKLEEDDAAEVAPVAPGDPFPALQEGDQIAGRYRVHQVLQTGPQRQTYLAADEKGYQHCWACGSTKNEPGETYCNDCGAQLSGRVYRLYEFPPDGELPEIPERLVDVGIPAVAQIIEGLTDETSGRHYIVVEDTAGRTMAELIVAAEEKESARPSAERLLNWMTQAADMLDELQKTDAVGCNFSPESLHVLADERVVMGDPVSCRLSGKNGVEEKQADTQRAAAALEQIYAGLSGQPMDKTPTYNVQSGKPEDLAAILRAGREGRYKNAAEWSSAMRDLFDSMVPPRDMQLISGRFTDVGVQRELNEDSLLVLEFLAMEAAGSMPVGIYVVADGMGGHQSGEVASSIAIRTVGSILQSKVLAGQVTGEDHLPDPERTTAVVREAVLEANRRIVELAQQRKSDMGTTVTLALVIGNQATIANVGDSRTYLYRDGRLQQISRDHSLVARLVAAGQLSTEESRYFERRNEIYLALGDAHLAADQIDVFNRTLRPFDALLLCSDGLWEMVPDVQIEGILRSAPDDSAAAQSLVNMANKNGGEDNISVIVAQAVVNDKDKKGSAKA